MRRSDVWRTRFTIVLKWLLIPVEENGGDGGSNGRKRRGRQWRGETLKKKKRANPKKAHHVDQLTQY